MNYKKIILSLLLFLVFFIIGFLLKKENSEQVSIKRTQIILGTLVEIEIIDEKEKAEAAMKKVFNEIKEIDSLFSTYNANSPVYRVNISKDSALKLPDEILNLMKASDYYWKLSNGYFDASLHALIEIWKFNSENPALPSKKEIKKALLNSGWDNIEIGKNSIKRRNNVQFNFGGIAKGYAVDKAISTLKNIGVDKALINAGGELKGIGKDWLIGIRHPIKENKLAAVVKLNGMSVATSGNYENYFIINNKRYHHLLNPFTGYPANELSSVTIISKSNEEADALSTAVFVMGQKKGLELIETLSGVEAMLIDTSGVISYSSKFKSFFAE